MKREEAIKILKELHDGALFSVRNALETLIPELAESEAERIRKQLVDIVAFIPEANFSSASREECRAYLEKQKEQKPAEWSEKHIADVFEKVGLAKIAREQGNDALANAVQSAMIELSKEENEEWSEEDEKVYNNALDAFYYKDYNDKDDVLFALKDLIDLVSEKRKVIPPYARWKPSEEQMKELEKMIKYQLSCGLHASAGLLQELINELRKLM